MENEVLKIDIESICTCECHVKDSDVGHFQACCDYTYEHYIRKDGSINYDKYIEIVKAYNEAMVTPFNYRIELDPTKAEKEGDMFVIYIKGEKELVRDIHILFGEKRKLTKKEAISTLKGTKGIINIVGDFKKE